MIALLASGLGKLIVKSPAVDVLSLPKSRTITALSAVPAVVELLYTKAPRAVMLAVDQVVSAKSVNAVVPDVLGVTLVNVLPPALYPVPEVSFVTLYKVVLESNVALDV